MSWYEFGKNRESLHYRGEMYKKTVIRYFQLQGYSLKASSSQEGTLVDIVLHKENSPDLYVETKDSDVSIFGKSKLKEEILKNLIDWFKRPNSKRFDFHIFVRSIRRPEESKGILGYNAIKENSLAWFKDRTELELSENDENALASIPDDDVYSFLKNTSVFIAAGYDIDLENTERMKELSRNPSIQVNTLYQEVKRRKDPIKKYTTVIIPFIELKYPETFYEVRSTYKLTDTIRTKLDEKGIIDKPVFIVPRYESEEPVVRSFENDLSKLYPFIEGIIRKRPTNVLDEQRIRELLNIHLNHIFYCKGLRRSDRDFYFAYEQPINPETDVEPIKVMGPNKNLKEVTKPRYDNNGNLNFVEHHSITMRLKQLGDTWGLFLMPGFVFTENGLKRIEGDHANRIERHYRNPLYTRNENIRSSLLFWEHFLVYGNYIKEKKSWFNGFKFMNMKRVNIGWSSEVVKPNQTNISQYLELE